MPSVRAAVALTLLGLALSAAACGDDPIVAPNGPSSERVTLRPRGTVAGARLGYVEYLPPGYGDGKRRPLLVFLHGAGEIGNGSDEGLLLLQGTPVGALLQRDEWPETRPFVVLLPQHSGGYEPGSLCPSAREIDRFLRFAVEHYDVDRQRVYLTGFSCGAIGTWDYLAQHGGELVAAAVPIAGDGNPAVSHAHCALARVPIWAFHGAVDGVVSKAGSIRPITRLRRCANRADLRLTVYPGVDHDAATSTYDLSAGHDVYAWLLEHRRP
jgi:predicted peptidase